MKQRTGMVNWIWKDFTVDVTVDNAAEEGLYDVWLGGDRVVENLDKSNVDALLDGIGILLERAVDRRLKKIREALGVKETLT